MLEAGSVNKGVVVNILFKNMMDVVLGAVIYFLVGYGFSYGGFGNDFIGDKGFALMGVEDCDLDVVFFQYVFAATATTIISGAMAGRTQVAAYVSYSLVVTGFIYPTVRPRGQGAAAAEAVKRAAAREAGRAATKKAGAAVRPARRAPAISPRAAARRPASAHCQVTYWVWSENAWLFQGRSEQTNVGYRDFAGSGVVHITGGSAALVGAVLLGPRLIRKKPDGSFRSVTPNSPELATLGTFILIFGCVCAGGFGGGLRRGEKALELEKGGGDVSAGVCACACVCCLCRQRASSRKAGPC